MVFIHDLCREPTHRMQASSSSRVLCLPGPQKTNRMSWISCFVRVTCVSPRRWQSRGLCLSFYIPSNKHMLIYHRCWWNISSRSWLDDSQVSWKMSSENQRAKAGWLGVEGAELSWDERQVPQAGLGWNTLRWSGLTWNALERWIGWKKWMKWNCLLFQKTVWFCMVVFMHI